MKPSPDLVERFWTRVERGGAEECWPWKLRLNPMGYGRMRWYDDGKAQPRLAHRIAWEIAHGRCLPDGLVARHTCDNPGCVNPRHIISGTQTDNHADMIERRRNANQRKTHCKNGHPFSGHNLITRKDGTRGCKACCRDRTARWRSGR